MTEVNQVITYEGNDGSIQISLLSSMLAWKRELGKDFFTKSSPIVDGICTICDGDGKIETEYGITRCLCWLRSMEEQLKQTAKLAKSFYNPASLDTFEIWCEKEDDRFTIKELLKSITEWIAWPQKWIYLYGNVGSGKTHILASIAEEFKQYALYITAGDLESLIFRATRGGMELTVDELVSLVSSVPILLIDDVGADYGAQYVKSILRQIIDYRYRRWQEYPVVIATNLGPIELIQYDLRIADRVRDTQSSIILTSPKVSYRTQKKDTTWKR